MHIDRPGCGNCPRKIQISVFVIFLVLVFIYFLWNHFYFYIVSVFRIFSVLVLVKLKSIILVLVSVSVIKISPTLSSTCIQQRSQTRPSHSSPPLPSRKLKSGSEPVQVPYNTSFPPYFASTSKPHISSSHKMMKISALKPPDGRPYVLRLLFFDVQPPSSRSGGLTKIHGQVFHDYPTP